MKSALPFWLTRLIRGNACYIDTISVRLPRYLTKEELSRVRRGCGGIISPRRAHPVRYRLSYGCFEYPTYLVMHQPNKETIEFINSILSKPAMVNRLDISLDLLTASFDAAQRLAAWVNPRLLKRWHRRNHEITTIGEEGNGTFYLGFRNFRSKIKSYADKLSKVTGQPCLHIEWVMSSRECIFNRCGIKTLDDVPSFSLRRFVAKQLVLAEIDTEALAKRMRGVRPNARTRTGYIGNKKMNWDKIRGDNYLKKLAEYDTDIQVHEAIMLIKMKGFRTGKQLLRFFDTSVIVPPALRLRNRAAG